MAPAKGKRPTLPPKSVAAEAAAKAAESRIQAEEARLKFTRIDAFEGPFDFLSMDHECDVGWDGMVFKSARLALLAAQFPTVAGSIAKCEGLAEARKVVEDESEASGWDMRRLKAMELILRDKFRRSDPFRKRLEETGQRELLWETEEDAFWGSSRGRGQNQLGRLLMEIRGNIQEGTELQFYLVMNCELETESLKRPPIQLHERKLDANGNVEFSKVHRLQGSGTFKLGKLPTNSLVAAHPSVSREHAMILHTKSAKATCSGGVAIMDLGSKAGLAIGGRQLEHSWVMEPIRTNDELRIGASTRTYTVKVNLTSQIEQLEQQRRDLLKEVEAIDADAADPVEAAKRAAKDDATVFVGNLDFETEKADMLGLFQDCGHVQDVRFPGGDSKATRGFCFVVFEGAMAARRACGLSGEMFKQRKVRVTPAGEGRKGGGVSEGKGGEKGKGEKGKGKGKGKGKDRSPSPRDRGPPGGADRGGPNRSRSKSAKGSRAMFLRDMEQQRDRGRERPPQEEGRGRRGASRSRDRSPDGKDKERRRKGRDRDEPELRERDRRRSPRRGSASPRKRRRSPKPSSEDDKRGRGKKASAKTAKGSKRPRTPSLGSSASPGSGSEDGEDSSPSPEPAPRKKLNRDQNKFG